MTKTYKLDNIEISEDQIKQLLKDHPELLEKKSGKPWRAEKGEYYYIINDCGELSEEYEDGDVADDYRYLTGNYFKTGKEAEAYKARQEAIGRVTHKILELNDGWKVEWKGLNGSEYGNEKYYIYANPSESRFAIDSWCHRHYAIMLPLIASQAIAEQIIKDHEADLKIIFNIK